MTTFEVPALTLTQVHAFYAARFTELAITAESARTFETTTTVHCTTVDRIPNNHGYPYQARCLCGWTSLAHSTRGVAEDVAAEHAGGRLAR